LAIPISETFIYVEPVYLEAKQEEAEAPRTGTPQSGRFGRSQSRQASVAPGLDRSRAASLPELKRVIVAFGNRVAMEENLERALKSVLSTEIAVKDLVSPPVPPIPETSNLGALALQHYTKAKAYLREGNWAEYGKELDNLERILKQMSGITKEEK
jgi:uncharacterized membrane protein (UPF0182 family)